MVVALVQADARLVEHVEHADQAGADLGGEPDALRLAARQRAGAAIQPWSGGTTMEYFLRLLEALANAEKFSVDTPWRQLPSRAQKTILYGS